MTSAAAATATGVDSLDAVFSAERDLVNRALEDVRRTVVRRVPAELNAAVDYALSGPGKRVRGVLVLIAHSAAGGKRDVSGLAAAIEVVHAYSLVHDDLPCMDDDDLRRGRPALHRKFGVQPATVAGAAMVPLAVLAALHGAERAALPRRTGATIVNELMRAAGAGGMIGGQLLDLDAEGRALPLADLDRIHRSKTGSLFGVASRIGGISAGAPPEAIDALEGFGRSLGLAFQIADDVLDVTATAAQLGKSAGRDATLHKSTYPAAIGVTAAADRARALIAAGCATLETAMIPASRLAALAELAVHRLS